MEKTEKINVSFCRIKCAMAAEFPLDLGVTSTKENFTAWRFVNSCSSTGPEAALREKTAQVACDCDPQSAHAGTVRTLPEDPAALRLVSFWPRLWHRSTISSSLHRRLRMGGREGSCSGNCHVDRDRCGSCGCFVASVAERGPRPRTDH